MSEIDEQLILDAMQAHYTRSLKEACIASGIEQGYLQHMNDATMEELLKRMARAAPTKRF